MPTFCREFIIALRPCAYSTLICIGTKMVQFRSAISKVLCFYSHVFWKVLRFWGFRRLCLPNSLPQQDRGSSLLSREGWSKNASSASSPPRAAVCKFILLGDPCGHSVSNSGQFLSLAAQKCSSFCIFSSWHAHFWPWQPKSVLVFAFSHLGSPHGLS